MLLMVGGKIAPKAADFHVEKNVPNYLAFLLLPKGKKER